MKAKSACASLVFFLLCAGLAVAQSALPVGTTFKIELQTKLDSKKAKVGDKVQAKCSDNVKVHGANVLPKNSVLTGIVTQATPAEGSQPAQLGILFNTATPKGGAAIAFRAAIVKVYADDNNSNNQLGMLTQPAEMTGGTGTNAAVMNGGQMSYLGLDRSSNGIPIQYSIQETASGQQSDLGGVVSSVRDNFTLDDGAHLQLRVLESGATKND